MLSRLRLLFLSHSRSMECAVCCYLWPCCAGRAPRWTSTWTWQFARTPAERRTPHTAPAVTRNTRLPYSIHSTHYHAVTHFRIYLNSAVGTAFHGTTTYPHLLTLTQYTLRVFEDLLQLLYIINVCISSAKLNLKLKNYAMVTVRRHNYDESKNEYSIQLKI